MALFVVACGVTPLQAQGLALAYRKGDVHLYSFHSSADEVYDVGLTDTPTMIDFTAVETVTVQSVDSGGVADLSIGLSRVVITSQTNGSTHTATDFSLPPVGIRITSDGRVLNVKNGMRYGSGSPAGLGVGRGSGLISAVLPDRPVKPGEGSRDDRNRQLGRDNLDRSECPPHPQEPFDWQRDSDHQLCGCPRPHSAGDAPTANLQRR